MTEAIKQWISDQAIEIAKVPGFRRGETVSPLIQMGAIPGLAKGIEISEEFAPWAVKNYHPNFDVLNGQVKGWSPKNRISEFFTTSQLLELYLKTLEP